MKHYIQWWKARKRSTAIIACLVLVLIIVARLFSATYGGVVIMGVPMVYLVFSIALPLALFLLLAHGNEIADRVDRKHDLSGEG